MSTTTNYSIAKPDVAGSSGAWGTILNAALDGFDSALKVVQDLANTMLSRTGGTMTGRLNTLTSTSLAVAKGSISGTVSCDLSAAQIITATITGSTTFAFTNLPSALQTMGVVFVLTNAGTSITWPSGTTWSLGTPPTLSTAGVDVVTLLTVDGGATWRALVAGKAFA